MCNSALSLWQMMKRYDVSQTTKVFLDPKNPEKVNKVFLKALYGLQNQAPRACLSCSKVFKSRQSKDLSFKCCPKEFLSDYAGANLDRKSTTGGCQFLGRRLITWQCKKQTIVALLLQTEYVAATSCLVESTEKLTDGAEEFLILTLFIYLCLDKSASIVVTLRHHPNSDLIFDDADGIDSLPNQAIFNAIQLMGYEGDLTVLTFNKALFSPQWRYPCGPNESLPDSSSAQPSEQRFPRKSFSKKHRVHKESVSKQGRKKAKGESSVQRDPLFDVMPEDKIDHMETELPNTDKEGVSTDFEKVSTDRPIVSTDGSKVSTDEQVEGTEEHNEGTEEIFEGTEEQRKGTEDQTKEEIATKASQTSTQTPTSMIFGDDETIATLLLNMSPKQSGFERKEERCRVEGVCKIVANQFLLRSFKSKKGAVAIEERQSSFNEQFAAQRKFLAHNDQGHQKKQTSNQESIKKSDDDLLKACGELQTC
ncbi:hypothetical protein Tco_1501990 [Tanacetum coccineum]